MYDTHQTVIKIKQKGSSNRIGRQTQSKTLKITKPKDTETMTVNLAVQVFPVSLLSLCIYSFKDKYLYVAAYLK